MARGLSPAEAFCLVILPDLNIKLLNSSVFAFNKQVKLERIHNACVSELRINFVVKV